MPTSIREAYGAALVKYGAAYPELVVLDADVSGSTQSALFGAAYPQRFFNMGIAEANMTAVAAGFAAVGKIPFVNTFATFLTSLGLLSARSFGSYSRLPIKLAGAYGGLSDMFDGPSHHSIDDLAVMRALPGFQVFVPSDAVQTGWLVKAAIETPSPVYLRLSREAFPPLYGEGEPFKLGKGKVLRDGRDAVVFACGLMAGNALKAAGRLSGEGVSLAVIDLFTLKPIDRELILRFAKQTGAVVTAEEHSVIGGLGSAVAEVLCAGGVGVPTAFVGLNDCHAETGPYASLQKKYKLDADAIAEQVRALLSATPRP